MKKILSVTLCLVTLIYMLSLPAVAAAPALSIDCGQTYAAGETFTVAICASDLTNCCSVSFHMTYDPAVVEVTSITAAEGLSDWIFVGNPEYEENELFVSLTGNTSKNLSGDIAHITFTARTTTSGVTEFRLVSLSAVDSSYTPIILSTSSKSVTITPMEQTLITVTPAPGNNGELLLHVDLSQASYYCGLTFILNFDNSRYTVSGVQRGADFSSAMGYLNKDYAPGKVFVSTVFSNPSVLNGRLATITLMPIAGTASAEDVSVEITDYAGSNFQPLDIDWIYMPATISSIEIINNNFSISANLSNSAPEARKYTVVAAYYSSVGKMLGSATSVQAIPAGGCSSYELSLPVKTTAAYARVFFLNSDLNPMSPALLRDLPN